MNMDKMVEIFERKDIEKIEVIGTSNSLLAEENKKRKYRSNAKSKKGVILGLLQKFRNDTKKGITYTPLELQKVFEEAINHYIEKPKKKEVVIVEGWKGKDSYEIYKGVDNVFMLTEYRQDKETGEVNESTHEVQPEHINYLLSIIRKLDIGEHYGARYFWRKIIDHYNLNIEIDAFNGGKYRALYYFPLYMFPLKCIEASNVIKVIDGGGGGIIRIR